jgi:hypothetical protein
MQDVPPARERSARTLYIKTSKGYTPESTYGIAEQNDLSHSNQITS